MTQTTNYNLNKFETTDKMNPTTLNGLNANADTIDTALTGKAPTDHASAYNTYGIGKSNQYGHCKCINNLTSSTAYEGWALNAYQGYLLQQNKQNKVTYSTTDLTPRCFIA